MRPCIPCDRLHERLITGRIVLRLESHLIMLFSDLPCTKYHSPGIRSYADTLNTDVGMLSIEVTVVHIYINLIYLRVWFICLDA
jgi:hypothetical protein